MRSSLLVVLFGIGLSSMSAARGNWQDAGLANDLAALAFLGGSPLTQGERSEVGKAFNDAAQADPGRLQRNLAALDRTMQSLHGASAERRADLRERWRHAQVMQDASAIDGLGRVEAEVVAAHDPVFVADKPNGFVITEQIVDALVTGGNTVARALGIAPPAPDARQILGPALQRNDAGGRTTAFADMQDTPRNLSFLAAWAQALPRFPKAAQAFRDYVTQAKDPVEREVRLAELTAMSAKRGMLLASSAGGGGPVAAMLQRQAGNMIVRSFNPQCAGTARADNGVYCSGMW